MLAQLAKLDEFRGQTKSGQAELIAWCLYELNGRTAVDLKNVVSAFDEMHLPKGNPTRIKEHFRKSRNIRKAGSGFAPTMDFLESCDGLLIFSPDLPEEVFDSGSIPLPPFVDPERQKDLAKMVRVYAQLFLLENSMRGLIEKVLKRHLGEDWWEKAANSPMKQKHEARVRNEKSKKWAPARGEFGPLYALDWPDLIKLMRKYPDQFTGYLGDINFLHRFEDAGSFRNVVAHNGVLREQDDFDLIRIYYQNWISQVAGN